MTHYQISGAVVDMAKNITGSYTCNAIRHFRTCKIVSAKTMAVNYYRQQ